MKTAKAKTTTGRRRTRSDGQIVAGMMAFVEKAGIDSERGAQLLQAAARQVLQGTSSSPHSAHTDLSTRIDSARGSQVDDDFVVIPSIAPASLSEIIPRMHALLERFSSPFDAEGDPVMMGGFKDNDRIGFVVTARFYVEGGDGDRPYTISGKAKGNTAPIYLEGEDVRVHGDGRPVFTGKEFKSVWKGKSVTGVLWLTAVHLPLGREFVMWMNSGTPQGDLEKRTYKVTTAGLVSVRHEI